MPLHWFRTSNPSRWLARVLWSTVSNTTSPTPRLRQAVRAVILDPDERVFLVQFGLTERGMWATPGGGIEPGETKREALARELAEEVGAIDVSDAPAIWTRTVPLPMGGYDGQRETYFLVHVDHQPLEPLLSVTDLRAEGVTASGWWTPAELAAATQAFAPIRLPALVAELARTGPPTSPFDVGV